MIAEFRAKITSKNQLTLPKGVSALLGVKPGDTVRFTIGDGGDIGVKPVKPSERLGPWIGYLKRNGFDGTQEQSARFIREMRGSLEVETEK